MSDLTPEGLRAAMRILERDGTIPDLDAYAYAWEQMDQEFDIDHAEMASRLEAAERELADKDAMWRAADRELEEVQGNLLALQRGITACGLNGVLNAWHEADIRGRRLSPSWLALHFHNLGEEQENSEDG